MSKSHAGSKTQEYLDRYMEGVTKRNPGQPEFVQAVYEVASSIFPGNIDLKDSSSETHKTPP